MSKLVLNHLLGDNSENKIKIFRQKYIAHCENIPVFNLQLALNTLAFDPTHGLTINSFSTWFSDFPAFVEAVKQDYTTEKDMEIASTAVQTFHVESPTISEPVQDSGTNEKKDSVLPTVFGRVVPQPIETITTLASGKTPETPDVPPAISLEEFEKMTTQESSNLTESHPLELSKKGVIVQTMSELPKGSVGIDAHSTWYEIIHAKESKYIMYVAEIAKRKLGISTPKECEELLTHALAMLTHYKVTLESVYKERKELRKKVEELTDTVDNLKRSVKMTEAAVHIKRLHQVYTRLTPDRRVYFVTNLMQGGVPFSDKGGHIYYCNCHETAITLDVFTVLLEQYISTYSHPSTQVAVNCAIQGFQDEVDMSTFMIEGKKIVRYSYDVLGNLEYYTSLKRDKTEDLTQYLSFGAMSFQIKVRK